MNSKLKISQYYDSLVREIDIFTEEQFAKIIADNNDTLISFKKLKKQELQPNVNNQDDNYSIWGLWRSKREKYWSRFNAEFNYENNLLNVGGKKTIFVKASDYLNQSREDMLAELARAQAETMERYETIKNEFNMKECEQFERINAKLFADKFLFLVQSNASNTRCHTKLLLVVLDFYLDQSQRVFLK